MPEWTYWAIAIPFAVAGLGALFFLATHVYYRLKFLDQVVRIFEEKPLFIIPRGEPEAGAEDVSIRTADGLTLRGCYLRHRGSHRHGVILFGLEFGSNRWSCVGYCERLRDNGYDVFAYEPRNQGDSDTDPKYHPLQWVTDKDLGDARAAAAYLRARPDADPRGFGVFGISKGGSVGLLLAAEDPAVRCVVTDGAFATYTTVVPYMRRWVSIYSSHRRLQTVVPDFFYGSIGLAAINKAARKRGVRFPWVESAVRKLRVPVLMIHGGADTYIKPIMAERLFAKCRSAVKELWMVPKAKHNQAPQVEPDKYHDKLITFFDAHLGQPTAESTPVDVPTAIPDGRHLPPLTRPTAEVTPQSRLA